MRTAVATRPHNDKRDTMSQTNLSPSGKLSVVEKIGYSLGDLAANLIFQTLLTFIAFFYTDVFKISANAAATIIFIGGLAGACFNPIMGLLPDRTTTRWGKFRPWLLWTHSTDLMEISAPALDAELASPARRDGRA